MTTSSLTATRRKEGYLLKWGGKLKKEWKRYNFELNRANFQYFKPDDCDNPKKQTTVCDIVSTEEAGPQSGIFPFVVHFRKLSSWTLAASTEGDRTGWMTALKSVANGTHSPKVCRPTRAPSEDESKIRPLLPSQQYSPKVCRPTRAPSEDESNRRPPLPSQLYSPKVCRPTRAPSEDESNLPSQPTDRDQQQHLEKNEKRLESSQSHSVPAPFQVPLPSQHKTRATCTSHADPTNGAPIYEFIGSETDGNSDYMTMAAVCATRDSEYVDMHRVCTTDDSEYVDMHRVCTTDDSEYVEMHLQA
eukprot:Em0011g748a